MSTSIDTGADPTTLGLEVQGVTHEFTRHGNTMTVCENIEFDVRPGEFLSIVGPSGCGKTTLLRIVGGLIKATSGTVMIGDEPVTGPGPDRGFVFQQDSLFPWRTLTANVRFGLEAQGARGMRGDLSRGEWRKESEARAQAAIELVGLKDFANHYPHELSGGMRQRANLARALAIGPRVLLMDEPFSALDAQTREIMQSELLRIWRQNATTVLFITHQIDEAVYLSDRVVVMSARPGRVRDVVDVDLPRPRDLHVKRTPEFVTYTDRIWRQIEQEARQAAMTSTSGG
ncbi:ABC transporter ATP-binding protein [Solirubrobacter ginsenosidimutans]|uniref:ABC transporter ATP-binding protein n=1 Tax=Solirubrobacter ginsenosidimutans TaxID=490573 RepID=A0A9X3RY36_9ACTN|nr:ABC transporter ATP-binding protein [Solirubrobacter ginsenosidimutans]MDA0159240.1 ABC transporter ATP-binding protein [Solirubrobacter ginsenosidimutans]